MNPNIINASLNDKFNNFSYPIFIGNGLLSNSEEILKKFVLKRKVILIHDNFFSLKNKEKVIISLGGGGFDNKEIRDLLLKNTNVIWLNTPVDLLIQRVGDGSKRPMIKGKTRDSILQLLKIRTKYYSLCHNQINTEKLNQNQITEKLINLISHQRNKAIK